MRRAGIQKRVWLHLLKHVSSTQDAMNGMPDSFRRYKHHWSQSSKTPAVYEHLSKDVIPKIQQESWRIMNEPDLGTKHNQLPPSDELVENLARELIRMLRENPKAASRVPEVVKM